MATQPKVRAAAKGVTISLGLIQTKGDLISPLVTNAGKEDKLVTVCPDCDTASKVNQFYRCETDATHEHTSGECAKAKQTDNGLVKLTTAQVKAAKTSDLPDNKLSVQVFHTSDVIDKTVHSGTTYVFQPEPNSGDLYGVLIDFILAHPEYTLMGLVKLSQNEKLMRLSIALNHQLVFEEMVWPEDMKEFSSPTVEYDENLLGLAEKLMESTVTAFDPTDFQKKSRERIATLVSTVEAGGTPAAPVKSAAQSVDLAALLEQSIKLAESKAS